MQYVLVTRKNTEERVHTLFLGLSVDTHLNWKDHIHQ